MEAAGNSTPSVPPRQAQASAATAAAVRVIDLDKTRSPTSSTVVHVVENAYLQPGFTDHAGGSEIVGDDGGAAQYEVAPANAAGEAAPPPQLCDPAPTSSAREDERPVLYEPASATSAVAASGSSVLYEPAPAAAGVPQTLYTPVAEAAVTVAPLLYDASGQHMVETIPAQRIQQQGQHQQQQGPVGTFQRIQAGISNSGPTNTLRIGLNNPPASDWQPKAAAARGDLVIPAATDDLSSSVAPLRL